MSKFEEIQFNKKRRSAYLRTDNKKHNVFDSESWDDLSCTVQKDTEVIHREVKVGTNTYCYLKENHSEFSEARRLKDLVKKYSQRTQEGDSRRTSCNIEYTSKDICMLTTEWIDEQIVDVRVPLSILEHTVAVMKLAPHEHAQTTHRKSEFHQREFINNVVDDPVKTQRRIPHSKWRPQAHKWWLQKWSGQMEQHFSLVRYWVNCGTHQ